MHTLTVFGVNAPGMTQAQFLESIIPECQTEVELSLLVYRRLFALGRYTYGFILMKKAGESWHTVVDCGWACLLKDEEDHVPIGADHIFAIHGDKIGNLRLVACGSMEEPPQKKNHPR